MEIMKHLDINDLENMCSLDNNFKSLCHNKHFWVEKIIHDNLILPHKIDNIHWIHYYKTIKKVTEHMNYLEKHQDEYLEIDMNNVNKLNHYFDLVNIKIEDYTLSSIFINYSKANLDSSEATTLNSSKKFHFTIVDDYLNTIDVDLSEKQIVHLLVYIYYYHNYYESFNYFYSDDF
jgi:hypothetical protein